MWQTHWSLLRAVLHHLKYAPSQAYGKMLLTWDKLLRWLEPSSVAKCKSWNFLPDCFLINTLLRANSQPLKWASETLWSLSFHTRLFGWCGKRPLVFLFKCLWDMLTNSLVISSPLSLGVREHLTFQVQIWFVPCNTCSVMCLCCSSELRSASFRHPR